ncbi:MAG: biotin--[acetyl-CoA-carboxylase] ligase [Candidatus Saccharicenans sp.]|nr:biotin--[acetyl-CoA-carboxylase] ligase [Candidatus Aminicenantes bacterium]
MIESFSGRKGREKIKFGDLTFRFSRLSSTMDFARQLARLNYPEGTAVIAKEQTAGRGTKGRVWHSAPGKGLYVSFILRPIACSLSLLPLTVGLAAVKAVEEGSGIRGQLKWPNDLILEGKKLGGILCEGISEGQKSQYAIAGIGINLNHSAKEFPPDISETATSLFLVTGKNYDNDEIFHLLSKNLQFWYNELEKGQDKKIIEEYQANLIILKGQNLILRTPDGEIKGQFEGIGPNGGLKLKLNQGKIKTFYASEIIKVLS